MQIPSLQPGRDERAAVRLRRVQLCPGDSATTYRQWCRNTLPGGGTARPAEASSRCANVDEFRPDVSRKSLRREKRFFFLDGLRSNLSAVAAKCAAAGHINVIHAATVCRFDFESLERTLFGLMFLHLNP